MNVQDVIANIRKTIDPTTLVGYTAKTVSDAEIVKLQSAMLGVASALEAIPQDTLSGPHLEVERLAGAIDDLHAAVAGLGAGQRALADRVAAIEASLHYPPPEGVVSGVGSTPSTAAVAGSTDPTPMP